MGTLRDTSQWTKEYRNERTAAARAARAGGIRAEQEQRRNARQQVLDWLAWWTYSTSSIVLHLAGRSSRLVTELRAEGLIHIQPQLIKPGKRVRRHGSQYVPITTLYLTKAGYRQAGPTRPISPEAAPKMTNRRHVDPPQLLRHNLLAQVAALHLLGTHQTTPSFAAFTPPTQHLSEPKLSKYLKPDASLHIEAPMIEQSWRDPKVDEPWPERGLFFIEVERSRKHPNEMIRFIHKLSALAEHGRPVLVTEQAGTMEALLGRIGELERSDIAQGPKDLKTLILRKECPQLLDLLP